MVKVYKIAVWKVEGQYHESADSATQAVRHQIIREMIDEQKLSDQFRDGTDVADWVSDNWDILEQKVKGAMAGT